MEFDLLARHTGGKDSGQLQVSGRSILWGEGSKILMGNDQDIGVDKSFGGALGQEYREI